MDRSTRTRYRRARRVGEMTPNRRMHLTGYQIKLGLHSLSGCLEKHQIFATSLCKIAGCNYSYINQLCGKSRKLVSRIKVSLFSSWRVNETERGTVLGLPWIG